MKDVSVVLLAAGSGSRMGTETKKQFLSVGSHPLIYYSLKAFQESAVSDIILVVSEGDEEFAKKDIVEKYGFDKVSAVVKGGSERCFSVYEGLKAVKSKYVLVHDGARCLISGDTIDAAIVATEEYEACEVAVSSVDTVKIADEDGFVAQTPDRSRVWSIQTPQGFSTELLMKAYSDLFAIGESAFAGITDDAMVVERAFPDKKIKLVEGSYENIKVTTPADLPVCEKILKSRGLTTSAPANTEKNVSSVKTKTTKKQTASAYDGFPDSYAFVDGSYNVATKVYGYGGFLVYGGEKYTLQGSGDDPEAAVSRNVAGEVSGAMAAVSRAMELGITDLTIYYDYEGIKQWAERTWKRNKKLTRDYEAFITRARESGMRLTFIHVKGHSGIPGNEEADKLAKEAVGVS